MERKEENITVAVRIRPLQEREQVNGAEISWDAKDSYIVKELKGTREFIFDQVYPPAAPTTQLFSDLGLQVVQKCIEGYNGCIFCYGQTGSGKTFTMHGNKKTPGIVPLTIESIFSSIQRSSSKAFLIRCSYIEIYNESINDLLNPELLNLQLAEDHKVLYS